MKEITVNSTKKELRDALKKQKLTLKEAQIIAMAIYDRYHKGKNELDLLCRFCYKKRQVHYIKSFGEYKQELSESVGELRKLNKMFYPYIKYDW